MNSTNSADHLSVEEGEERTCRINALHRQCGTRDCHRVISRCLWPAEMIEDRRTAERIC